MECSTGEKGTDPPSCCSRNINHVCKYVLYIIINICIYLLFLSFHRKHGFMVQCSSFYTDHWITVHHINPLHGYFQHGSTVSSCPSCHSCLESVCVLIKSIIIGNLLDIHHCSHRTNLWRLAPIQSISVYILFGIQSHIPLIYSYP